MRVKAAKGGLKHKRGMLAALIRLLTIAAFVLMPFAMSGSTAMATELAPSAASVPCESHGEPSKAPHESRAHCTSCVAIAQSHSFIPIAIPRLALDLTDRSDRFLLGCLHEVATPPPRAARS